MHKQDYDNSISQQLGMVVILLMAIGTVFVFSAGADVTSNIELGRFYKYSSLRQLIFFPMAIFVMFITSRIDYRRLGISKGLFKSPPFYLLAISIILLVIVLIPRFGAEINYARRWLRIPVGPVQLSFQPSELAKWVLIIFLAAACCRYNTELKSYIRGFSPICAVIGLVAGLILIEDFGTAALVCLLSFCMLAIAGAKWLHLLSPIPLALAAFTTAILVSPERKQRILAFLHPDKWTDSINYQPSQSLIALGSGGVLGKGLGMGICKYGHLPEDTTDFIFAIIGEELGIAGTVGVILLFIAFIWLGTIVVVRCSDPFGQLLAGGIVMAIAIQAALNIGVVTVVLPTKGIPLPFVSAGGTSLLLSAAAVGVLMNISKQSPKLSPEDIE
ncbi:MAG: cell division protein FtsW [Sedimentisphaerales bacterium]|nr:cell division protein FtsW [Sedimentisphaerales bacterium]